MLLSESQANIFDTLKAESSDEEFVKPKMRMKVGGSPVKNGNVVVILDDENNDEDERLARRKSRLLEPHLSGVSSPGGNSSISKNRADAAAPRGIPQAQIGEHYGNCIRLAAENKITAKNAFSLHLIDYMSEVIKSGKYETFQVASSSLDAGAKIYAGRVDAVHQETYQVLTGLGRSDKSRNVEDKGDNDENNNSVNNDEDDEAHAQSKPEQKKKVTAHRDIIHKQLNKIRIKTLADKIDVDPLFQHQTAAYDDGGTAELRLNQLSTANASCELILDSSTPVMLRTSTIPQPKIINATNLTEFLSVLITKSLNQLSICSTLQNFHFTDWDPTKDALNTSNQGDWDANTQPIDAFDLDNDDDDDNGINFLSADNSFGDNTIREDANMDPVLETSGMEIEANGASAEAQHNENGENNAGASVGATEINTEPTNESELFVSCLKSMLDKQYEHFGKLNDHLLGMWAGPEHWRRKAKRPRLEGALKSNEEHAKDGDVVETCVKTIGNRKGSKSTKKDKGQKISYLDALKPGENRTKSGKLCRRDWLNSIQPSGVENSAASNATVFKESYRLKASRQMNMIPSEISDTRQSLYQIVNRDVLLRSNTQPDGKNTVNGSHKNNENGDNVNGMNELIVGVPDNGNMYGDDDMDDGLDHRLPDHDDDDDDDALPFECAFTQNTGYNDYGLDDMELISQPNKVARIEIGYARTAKMINVQRLKSAMWQFLEHSIPRVNPNIQSLSPSVASTTSAPDAGSFVDDATSAVNAGEDKEKSMDDCVTGSDEAKASCLPKVPGAKSFSEVIDSLSGRISWQMAKELSISIALNCLLHMSNEKQLYLENVDNFSNIFISQGLPSFELKLLESYTQPDDDSPDTPSGQTVPNSTNSNNNNNQKRNKAQRVRMSTLDSWLEGSDDNE
ncbi:unnamed protein product [Trichobilharzia szidati]|nr:unnamed protein product [Trichobilharzia szidati]